MSKIQRLESEHGAHHGGDRRGHGVVAEVEITEFLEFGKGIGDIAGEMVVVQCQGGE